MVELSKNSDDIPMICGDMNGHVGARNTNYEGVHGNHGYGVLNNEGIRLLDFCVANELILVNTWFIKREQHLITYKSGETQSQIDFIMYPKKHFKVINNAKMIPSEECFTQHKLLVCDLTLGCKKTNKIALEPRLKTWILREAAKMKELQQEIESKVNIDAINADVETIWSVIKEGLHNAAKVVCGETKGHALLHKGTEWWTEQVGDAIKEKRRAYKAWKTGLKSHEENIVKKKKEKHEVYHAKKKHMSITLNQYKKPKEIFK